MKKQLIITIVSVALCFTNAFAYYGPGEKDNKPGKPKGANCSPATAKLTMDFNDVSALIEQGGSMFQNRQASIAAYEVPKDSKRFAIFAGNLGSYFTA